jgi:TonB family protein
VCLVLAAGACGGADEPLQQPVPAAGENDRLPGLDVGPAGGGETMLLVHVTEFGEVDSAYVEATSGQDEFDSAAVVGARKLQFTPGRRASTQSPWTRLPVRFALDSTASVAHRAPINGGQR